MSNFVGTSILLGVITSITIIILLMLSIYYIIKKNNLPIEMVKQSLPIIGSSTGSYMIKKEIIIDDPIYDIFGQPIINTPLIQLDSDSHIYAMSKFCNDKGYGYDFVDNVCTHTRSTCLSTTSPTGYLLEWHDPYCISTSSAWKETCDLYEFGYNQGRTNCDFETKLCTNERLPSCVIDGVYCRNKGVDYDSSGNGDCYTNDPQAISQMVFGTTITNQYRRSIDDAIESCGGPANVALLSASLAVSPVIPVGLFASLAAGSECGRNMTLLYLAPAIILGKTFEEIYTRESGGGNASMAVKGTVSSLLLLPTLALQLVTGLGSMLRLPSDFFGKPGSAGNRPSGMFG